MDLLRARSPDDRTTIVLLESHQRIDQLSTGRRHIKDLHFLEKVAADAYKVNGDVRAACLAKAPPYLKDRIVSDAPLPQVHLLESSERPWRRGVSEAEKEEEAKRRVTLGYVLQMEAAGGRRTSLKS